MKLRKLVVRWLAAVCLVAALTFPSYGTNSEMKDAKNQIDSLEEEKKKMEQTLGKLEGLKNDAAAYVRQLDSSLETLNIELNFLEEQINNKETEIASAQAELLIARDTEIRQYESMKLRIKYIYEMHDTNYIELILESSDFSELLNRAEYISQLSEYDRSMLDKYAATKEDIAAKELRLQMERDQILELKGTTEAKRASVEQLISTKEQELKKFESEIHTAENQIDEYQADIDAQENKMKQIEAEIKRKEEEARKAAEEAGKKYNTVSIGNINFIWPCPSSSRITSGFGGRSSPTEGASTNHQGIDISSSTGSNIIAAAAGEVIISTYSYSAGNYIMINHGGGVMTVYMHCSQLLASVGDQVTQGQVIAKVGSTGYSTGSHLHFGVRVNGSYVNPTQYVSP